VSSSTRPSRYKREKNSLSHHDLEQRFSNEFLLLRSELDVELLEHGLKRVEEGRKSQRNQRRRGEKRKTRKRTIISSFLKSVTTAKILKMGSKQNMLKALSLRKNESKK